MFKSFFLLLSSVSERKKPNEFGQKLYSLPVFFASNACRHYKQNFPKNQVFFKDFKPKQKTDHTVGFLFYIKELSYCAADVVEPVASFLISPPYMLGEPQSGAGVHVAVVPSQTNLQPFLHDTPQHEKAFYLLLLLQHPRLFEPQHLLSLLFVFALLKLWRRVQQS